MKFKFEKGNIYRKGLPAWNKGLKNWMPEESNRRRIEKMKRKPAWNKGKRGLQIAWNKGTKGICKAWNIGDGGNGGKLLDLIKIYQKP